MAKCKLCKTNIPDGTEYCEDCQDKGRTKANESYLDSLLNSVKNSTPTAESIYKKKNNSNSESIKSEKKENLIDFDHSSHEDIENDFIEPTKDIDSDINDRDMYSSIDLSDIEDFDKFYPTDNMNDFDSNIVIGDEELFGEDLSNIFSDEESEEKISKEINQKPLDEVNYDSESKMDDVKNESVYQTLQEDASADEEIAAAISQSISEEDEETENVSDNLKDVNENEIDQYQEEDSFDDDLNDLLNSLNLPDDNIDDNNQKAEETLSNVETEKPAPLNEKEENEIEIEPFDDDFLSLLQQISSDDPVAEDVKAINDLLSGEPVSPPKKANMPSDVGEVFSDALKAVSSLKDFDVDEDSILSQIPDKKGKKGKKEKKSKKQKKVINEQTEDSSTKKEKSDKNIFQRIFGNVKDENAQIKKKGSKQSKPQTVPSSTEQPKKEGKQDKKGKKVKKGKKGSSAEDIDETLDDNKQGKDKKASKKDSKKEKTEKKKKTKEIIQVIDEIDEDEGRINRFGATVVFIFFGLLVMLLLVGTNAISYTLNIQNATNYFEKQRYTQAYNEVYGIDIKDEDIEIYDKIKTVMFVNKQLNSYNNYYFLKQYPEALDALLKGLSRYDKYIELATMLGIKTDLDYVRTQILAELNNVFNLTEKEALDMIDYDSMEEYSLEIYDVVLEKMN